MITLVAAGIALYVLAMGNKTEPINNPPRATEQENEPTPTPTPNATGFSISSQTPSHNISDDVLNPKVNTASTPNLNRTGASNPAFFAINSKVYAAKNNTKVYALTSINVVESVNKDTEIGRIVSYVNPTMQNFEFRGYVVERCNQYGMLCKRTRVKHTDVNTAKGLFGLPQSDEMILI